VDNVAQRLDDQRSDAERADGVLDAPGAGIDNHAAGKRLPPGGQVAGDTPGNVAAGHGSDSYLIALMLAREVPVQRAAFERELVDQNSSSLRAAAVTRSTEGM
jgi:hypothetical protein